MSELNPSEAQRKAMAEYLAGEYQAPSEMFDRCLKAVDALFAAANGIPEGAPVGTIARRPDGKYLAHRVRAAAGILWEYKCLAYPEDWEYLRPDDADSWPVIYDPREPVERDGSDRGADE